jgi:clumping factor A
MTQKNETQMESKADTETKATPAKPAKTTATQSNQTKTASSDRGGTGDLSPELVELVTELRDTVKRLDPRKHTAKTLRRSLFNVRDILADIEALDSES